MKDPEQYECPAPPGEFEDDDLHALWFVEVRDPSTNMWMQTRLVAWEEATNFVDGLLEISNNPEAIDYTISRVS